MFALDTKAVIYFFKGADQVQKHLFSTPPPDIALPLDEPAVRAAAEAGAILRSAGTPIGPVDTHSRIRPHWLPATAPSSAV